jgi:hypothetical protein
MMVIASSIVVQGATPVPVTATVATNAIEEEERVNKGQ